MTTLLECLGHEPGFFNLALDVMLRRGVVSPAAAADWATSASVLESVHTSYWPHKHLEVKRAEKNRSLRCIDFSIFSNSVFLFFFYVSLVTFLSFSFQFLSFFLSSFASFFVFLYLRFFLPFFLSFFLSFFSSFSLVLRRHHLFTLCLISFLIPSISSLSLNTLSVLYK